MSALPGAVVLGSLVADARAVSHEQSRALENWRPGQALSPHGPPGHGPQVGVLGEGLGRGLPCPPHRKNCNKAWMGRVGWAEEEEAVTEALRPPGSPCGWKSWSA